MGGLLSTPFALLQKKDPDRYHYLLWFKFVLLNMFFLVITTVAYFEGWVDKVFGKDPKLSWLLSLTTFDVQTSYILLMSIVFLFGWGLSVYWAFLTSREINFLKMDTPPEFSRVAEYLGQIDGAESISRHDSYESLREKWFTRLSVIGNLSGALVLMGLFGTVIGFIIALSGVRPDAANDIASMKPMIAALISGMSVALYTTIAGTFLGGFWLKWNYRIIQVGSSDFLTLLRELGERRGKQEKKQEAEETNTDTSVPTEGA